MDSSEEAFFLEFNKQLPESFYIFPKIRIADIVETTNGKGYKFNRNKILPKHIDFLVVDKNFHPVLAIELNGSSHEIESRKSSDRQKKKIFESIGLPLEFIEVGSIFSLIVENLIKKYITN